MKLKLVALFAATAASALAQLINISTGANTSGAPLVDNDWLVNGATPFIVQSDSFPVPNPWLGYSGTGSSLWISANNINAAVSETSPLGLYTYTRTFTLTAFEAASANLTFKLANDNGIVNIFLNATNLGYSGGEFIKFSAPLVVNTGFITGVNTLTIRVANTPDNVGSGNEFNPSGLRVDGLVNLNAVPEPSTYGAIAAGFLVVGIWIKRRRSKA